MEVAIKCDYPACAEMEMGQWVMGHGSNGSPFVDGSHGSWGHWLTHDDEITAQYSLQYFVLS